MTDALVPNKCVIMSMRGAYSAGKEYRTPAQEENRVKMLWGLFPMARRNDFIVIKSEPPGAYSGAPVLRTRRNRRELSRIRRGGRVYRL